MADRLVDVADDLYGVAPAGFIAARGARAAELSGDKELAARVKELRKPAPAAWVVNLLDRGSGVDAPSRGGLTLG